MLVDHASTTPSSRLHRSRLLLVVALIYLLISTLTRVGVAAMATADRWIAPAALARAFVVGALLDVRSAAWIVVPFALYLAVLPERWYRHRLHRAWIQTGLAVAFAVFLFVATAEGFFFAEFDGRFNFVAVDYLMYPTEVTTNIRESYPLGAVLSAVAILALGTLALVRRRVALAFRAPAAALERWGMALTAPALAVGLTAGLPHGIERVSADREVNELAANGWGSFVAALWGSHADYEGLYATADREDVADRLTTLLAEPGSEVDDSDPLGIDRQIDSSAPPLRWNVVVVLEESFGSEFVGALHPRSVSLTPRFDALTREGVLWTHAYSTGNRTIRAIEATTSSLPPLPGVSIVRRPQSEHLFTLPEVLRERGYLTSFIYGGRALFDGMGRYLRQNGVDTIVEQSDYPDGTFSTAWGVADEAIFERALVEMDRMETTGKPFYSLVLSVSNHRPFLFPTDHVQRLAELKGRENAVRYADDALGRFIDEARGHAFFDHTLFVLMGDHGARVYGAAEIPLASYEVPILFFAPKLLAPGRIDTLASSIDVPPSILARLGLDYESEFFGHDLFSIDPSHGRALMTHNSEIALMRGGRIGVLGLHDSAQVFAVDGTRFAPLEPLDAAARELVAEAIAYYYGADLVYRRATHDPTFQKTFLPPPVRSRSPATGDRIHS